MRTIINNFLITNSLSQNDAISLLNEYCRYKNNREITPEEINILINQLSQLID